MPDFNELAEGVITAAQGFISRALVTVGNRIDALEQRFAALPTPKDGVDGKDGRDGVDGTNGKDGKDGKNGLDGSPGVNGENGKDGMNGKDGSPGIQGEKGIDGRDGKDGRDGIGIKGDPGPQGEPGRDALEARILREIDPCRSYPRGTYAIHDGAWIHAMRATGPIDGGLKAAGWEVLLETPTNWEIVFGDDLRTITATLSSASGKRIERTMKLPVIIDRGVWKQAGYERGDAVTRDGSLWIAQRDTDGVPGSCVDWRLAVKRGRDGKDGKLIEPTKSRPVHLS